MAQFWDPKQNRGLGSSLDVLKQVADSKLAQVLERQQYRQQQERGIEIAKNLAFPEQQAKAFGAMSPMERKAFISEFGPYIAQNMRKQQGQQESSLQQLLQRLQPQQQIQSQDWQQLGQQRQPQQAQIKVPQQISDIEKALTMPNQIDQMARNALGATQPMVLAPQMEKK